MGHRIHGSAAATRRVVPESAKSSTPSTALLERALLRTIEQLQHAAALAESSRQRSPSRAAGHVVAILDDLERELSVLRRGSSS